MRSITLLLALLAISATAQKRAFTVEDVYRVKSPSGLVVTADGKVACAISRSDLKAQSSATDIFIAEEGRGEAAFRPVTTDGKSFAPQWSAKGTALYYSSSRSGTTQVYCYDLATQTTTQLTNYALGTQGAVVSPDGRLVAFAAEVWPEIGGADGQANAAADARKAKAPVQAHMADGLLFRHWTDYTDCKFWHIIVYDIGQKTCTDVTPGAFHAPTFSPSGPSGFAFSPDSRELCYLSNHDAHPEASTNADLWVVSVKGGEARNITADNPAWDGSPQYSPDGRYIAYRTQLVPGYESDRFRLALYDRATGEKTILTDAYDNWVDDFQWAADSKSLYFLGEERGYEPLYQLRLKDKRITKLIGDRALSCFAVRPKGQAYYVYSTTGKLPAIYAATPDGTHTAREGAPGATLRNAMLEFVVLNPNKSLQDEVDLRPSEAHWVVGADGDSVEYFIVKPHDFDPSRKYPLVINVHGGPQMQWMDSYRPDWQVYPGAGYVVAYPNPHGSTGYGQAFCRAISGSWGGRPFEDVMRVTDALARLEWVDSTRMGAMGWSYGGYFMNWLQGHTRRFKCLASMMGLFDLRSMWGSTEELWFPNFDLGGQPWNSELYRRWSPSEYVERFATPTLIITGERDYRVPYTQSLQYFSTLQTLGIPSRLIVFKNDGHWPSSLHSMPLYYNAHLEWFHQWLGGAPAPWRSEDMVNGNMAY